MSSILRRGDRVEGGGRLVEQQDFGVGRQRPRDAQPLLLAAGELERPIGAGGPSLRPTGPRRAGPSRPARPAPTACVTNRSRRP